MRDVQSNVKGELERLTIALIEQQREDGSWRYCFENGTAIDAYVVIPFEC
nr:hypothetical protein [Paenibacillus sp. GM2]